MKDFEKKQDEFWDNNRFLIKIGDKFLFDWAKAYCSETGLGADKIVLVVDKTPTGIVFYFERKNLIQRVWSVDDIIEASKDDNNA